MRSTAGACGQTRASKRDWASVGFNKYLRWRLLRPPSESKRSWRCFGFNVAKETTVLHFPVSSRLDHPYGAFVSVGRTSTSGAAAATARGLGRGKPSRSVLPAKRASLEPETGLIAVGTRLDLARAVNCSRYLIPALLALGGCVGCATPGAKVASWIRAQGGVSTDAACQSRVEHVAKWFGSDLHGAPLHVRVLDSEEVGAYGWRGGELFVTRGLVDLLDDQELAAALAHEMGHLLGDGSARPLVRLSGGVDADANLMVEANADRLGADFLRRQHLPAQAMPRMLAKVARATGMDGSCRDALRRRIELLRSAP